MKWFAALVLAAIAAGCTVPDSQKATFQIENKTAQPVIVKASMGPYSKNLVLAPHVVATGWIYAPMLTQKQITIEIWPIPGLAPR